MGEPLSKLRVGLVGLGAIHGRHVRGYEQANDICSITAVCDVDADKAAKRAAELGATPYTSFRELIASAAVDVVDVILPHHMHVEVVREALTHGKHTIVEKPIAPSVGQARQLVELAERKGVRFTVAENTRFVAAYAAAARVLAEGTIGAPRLIRTLICGSEVSRLSRPDLWKGRRDQSVGGAIFDAGPHSFFLVEWLAGPITEVWSVTGKVMDASEVEDYAVVGGRVRDGARFTSEFTFTAENPWNERLEIYATAGTLIVDQLCDPPAMLYRGPTSAGDPIPEVAYAPREWKATSIADGVEDFVRAVAEDRQPTVDPESCVRTIAVIEAAYAAEPDFAGAIASVRS